MPAYEICYMKEDGSLACTLTAMCKDDLHAKILAHAMKLSACRRLEVWRGRKLVYERPQYFGEAALQSKDRFGVSGFRPDSSPAQQPFA